MPASPPVYDMPWSASSRSEPSPSGTHTSCVAAAEKELALAKSHHERVVKEHAHLDRSHRGAPTGGRVETLRHAEAARTELCAALLRSLRTARHGSRTVTRATGPTEIRPDSARARRGHIHRVRRTGPDDVAGYAQQHQYHSRSGSPHCSDRDPPRPQAKPAASSTPPSRRAALGSSGQSALPTRYAAAPAPHAAPSTRTAARLTATQPRLAADEYSSRLVDTVASLRLDLRPMLLIWLPPAGLRALGRCRRSAPARTQLLGLRQAAAGRRDSCLSHRAGPGMLRPPVTSTGSETSKAISSHSTSPG